MLSLSLSFPFFPSKDECKEMIVRMDLKEMRVRMDLIKEMRVRMDLIKELSREQIERVEREQLGAIISR